MIRIATSLVALLLAFGVSAVELNDRQRTEVEERIAPVGAVCLQGDTSCGGAATVASAEPRSGEAVYNAACMACHTTGAGGAPKLGDVEAWVDRIAKGKDVLHESGIKGIAGTGMIAKGGCMSCSDQEIMTAVDYMVENSR
jgi:cytochrome c5